MTQVSEAKASLKQNRGFILGSLSFGHGIAHLYDQAFPLLVTEIAEAMGLGTFQKASMFAVRQVGSGVVNLGGGPLVDMLKSQWGLILTGCMIGSAVSFAFLGASPNFTVLLIAVVFVSIPGSLWHLPSTVALSQRFPDRRGFAISMHGFVASICNFLAPVLAGALLGVLFWRHVLFIYAGPALFMAIFVWWSLKDLGKEGGQEERIALKTRFQSALMLLKNRIVLGLVLVSVLRLIGLSAVMHWAPFYLKDELGMSNFEAGYHLGLLYALGIVSSPVLGALSDRFGRKQVLVPGLIISGILSLLVVSAGDSYLLLLVFAGMGFFTFVLHMIMQASVLDVVGRGTEATSLGILFGLGGIVGGVSPFLSAAIIDHLGGYGTIFYYAGIVSLLAAALVFIIPLPARNEPAPTAA